MVTLRPEDGQFPAFYTRKSGVRSPDAVHSEEEAAGVAAAQLEMRTAGMLLAVPIPARYEADPAVIAAALETATQEKEAQGISGRETTPFLLARIAELTQDHSLKANMHLVENNAATAARIAVLMCARAQRPEQQQHPAGEDVRVVVAGGCAVDVTAAPAAGAPLRRGTSNPGTISLGVGGVGRNVASAACAAGVRALLVSAVGDDALGRVVLARAREEGLADGVAVVPGATTAAYCALNHGDGDLETAVADMQILEQPLPALARGAPALNAALATAGMLCIDANLSARDVGALAALARRHEVRVWFEPVSVAKCVRVFEAGGSFAALHFMSPNAAELASMWRHCFQKQQRPAARPGSPSRDAMAEDLLLLHRQQGGQSLCIVCTLGVEGLAVYRAGERVLRVPAAPVPGGVVASTSGAGDTLAGCMIGRMALGDSVEASARVAVVAAAACCARKETTLVQAKL